MTTLPEEAVKAYIKAFGNTPRTKDMALKNEQKVRHALTAALPFLPVQGAVKKLEWENSAAQTQFGEYTIVFDEDEEMHETPYCAFSPNDNIGHYENEEAAKAAAQADYEARVMSAIDPVVPVSRPSAARELALDVEFATIRAMIYCYEGDSAQAFEAQKALAKIDAAIRALSSPDHADAGKVEGDNSDDPYEKAAKAAGWRYSPAHDGWIHDDERTGYREGMASYEPQPTAEAACWLHDIAVIPSAPASEGAE